MTESSQLIQLTEKLIQTCLNDDRYIYSFDENIELKSSDFNNAQYADTISEYLGGGFGVALIYEHFKSLQQPGYGSSSNSMPLDSGISYYNHYAAQDPRVKQLLDAGPNITTRFNFKKSVLSKSLFSEWLLNCGFALDAGISHCYTTPVDGLVTGLTVFPLKGKTITDDHVGLVNKAARVALQAHLINKKVASLKLSCLAYEFSLGNRREACVLFDANYKVIWFNDAFCHLMSNADLLQYAHERITFRDPAHQKIWKLYLERALNHIKLAENSKGIWLTHKENSYCIQFYSLPRRSALNTHCAPRVLVEITKINTHCGSISAKDIRSIFSAFKITPAESVIMQLVYEGYSNKEICEYRGVKESAVQKQLSSIYSKLKIQNRFELLRLLLKLD